MNRLIRRVLEGDRALKRKASSKTSLDFSISIRHPYKEIIITRS